MNFIFKILLSPLAAIYGAVILFRNWLYKNHYLRSISFDVPVISIGNLSTGGTGKTPHIYYLIELLKEHFPLGVLSRGYRRASSGYLDVSTKHTASEIGDEPLLTKWKFPEVHVAVGEDRAMSIPNLVSGKDANFVVLLDDAFQHRGVRPGLNILLSAYHKLYTDDYLLPIGNLREFKSGAKRADIIIVSHSPKKVSLEEKKEILNKLGKENYQHVFFSSIEYQQMYRVFSPQFEAITPSKESTLVLLTGIADNSKVTKHLKENYTSVFNREFADHYHFKESDIESIMNTYKNIEGEEKYIVTTEKDLTRLLPFANKFNKAKIPVLCLPIKIIFAPEEKQKFDKAIHFYLEKTFESTHIYKN